MYKQNWGAGASIKVIGSKALIKCCQNNLIKQIPDSPFFKENSKLTSYEDTHPAKDFKGRKWRWFLKGIIHGAFPKHGPQILLYWFIWSTF